jgi:recombinational DNA repair ATPase RecF
MRIARVDLENVKSYERESIVFTPGTNAICGQNGAGKSTVLEAVGFAIFDHLATTQDQFVCEGEKVATVTVHLAESITSSASVAATASTTSTIPRSIRSWSKAKAIPWPGSTNFWGWRRRGICRLSSATQSAYLRGRFVG